MHAAKSSATIAMEAESGSIRYRVLHVGEVVRGGIATYLRSTIPTQRERYGDDGVLGLYPAEFADDLRDVFLAPRLAPWRKRGPGSLFRFGLAVASAIRDLNPDLVHAHSTFAGFFVRVVMLSMPRKRRPIVVYCAHGWAFLQETRSTKRWVYAALERLLTPLADGVVHISQHEARSAAERGIVPAAQVTIYNGLPDKAYPVKVDGFGEARKLVLLFAGRRDRQKGLDILFDALRLVKRRDIVLHVVGDAVISEGAVPIPAGEDRIVSHGWASSEEMEALYLQADVVVMPSRWEGCGYVALEAMRAGCAVFASRRGALPELVVDDVTGRLFDPQRPQDLARLIDGAEIGDLKRMGQRGRTLFVSQFSADSSNDSLLRFYDSLVSSQLSRGLTPLTRRPVKA